MSDEKYETLYVNLLEEEIARYATEMAVLDETIRMKEDEAKRVSATYKEDLKTLDARRATLAQRVRERKERRDVPVAEQKDFSRKAISTIRLDTGEIVRERAMNSEELQTELDFKKTRKFKTVEVAETSEEPTPRRRKQSPAPTGDPVEAGCESQVSLAQCTLEDMAD